MRLLTYPILFGGLLLAADKSSAYYSPAYLKETNKIQRISLAQDYASLRYCELELVELLSVRADIISDCLKKLSEFGMLEKGNETKRALELEKELKRGFKIMCFGDEKKELPEAFYVEVAERARTAPDSSVKVFQDMLNYTREGNKLLMDVIDRNPKYNFQNKIPDVGVSLTPLPGLQAYEGGFLDNASYFCQKLVENNHDDSYRYRWFSGKETLKQINHELEIYRNSDFRKRFLKSMEWAK